MSWHEAIIITLFQCWCIVDAKVLQYQQNYTKTASFITHSDSDSWIFWNNQVET